MLRGLTSCHVWQTQAQKGFWESGFFPHPSGNPQVENRCMWIRALFLMWRFSTLSTWFSTFKCTFLREFGRDCGKLPVGFRGVDNFSTCEANVEKPLVFVENLWEVYEFSLSTCGRIVTKWFGRAKGMLSCMIWSSGTVFRSVVSDGVGRTWRARCRMIFKPCF